MSIVKCPKCGQSFDKEKVECLHLGTRYYHLSCCSEDFIYTEKIFEYTKSLWGAVSRPKITKQIEAFKKETGCSVLINTSFNVRGEPIVCSPQDAYRCFMRTDMDILVLENCILYKENQPEFIDDKAWRDEYELD